MRTHSYQDMLKEYEAIPLDQDDMDERKKMLSVFKYSAIVEGNFLEYDNAEKWVKDNLNIKTINSVFYGKTGYDYGFMEYFFDNEENSIRFKNEIPNIYTKYPNGSFIKSDGYNKDIPYNT
jgi:hypothetical protein